MLSLKPCFVFLHQHLSTSLDGIPKEMFFQGSFSVIFAKPGKQRWSEFLLRANEFHTETNVAISTTNLIAISPCNQFFEGSCFSVMKVIRHPHRFHDLLLNKNITIDICVMFSQFHKPSPKKKNLLHRGSTEAPGPVFGREFETFGSHQDWVSTGKLG